MVRDHARQTCELIHQLGHDRQQPRTDGFLGVINPRRGHLLLMGCGVSLAGELPLRVGGLLHEQRQHRLRLSLLKRFALKLVQPVGGHTRIDISFLDRDTVALNRVSFAAQQRPDGLHCVLRRTTERGGQVSAERHQLLGLPGYLLHGHTHVLKHRARRGGQLAVLTAGQTYSSGSFLGLRDDRLGVLAED